MSQQQFNGVVEQVAAGDIKNFVEAPKVEKEYLSSAQRQALNALVGEISAECEIDARIIWREVVHARVGVEKIGEIPKEKFLEAQDALVCYRGNQSKQANIKLLVARITTATKAQEIYNQRDAFCLRQFGEKHLNAMSIDQLRQVLVFVEDFVKPEQPAGGEAQTAKLKLQEFKALGLRYPWQFGLTLCLGAVLGKLIF